MVASPEWTPAFSTCSMMAEATTSPRSATASSSISLAFMMNLEMTTGYSGRDPGSLLEVAVEVVLVEDDAHGRPAQDVGRPDEDGVADRPGEALGFADAAELAPLGLVDAELIEELGELEAVLGPVDARRRRPQDAHAGLVAAKGDVVGDLPAHGQEDAQRFFLLVDIEDALEAELVEIEPVADVVVGRYRLRIVVDHDRRVAELLEGQGGVDAAPVELDRGPDAVRARAEDHDLAGTAVAVAERDVVLAAVVGHVEVIRLGRVLGGQGVDLLHGREEAGVLPPSSDLELRRSGEEGDLLVGEAFPFRLEEEVRRRGSPRRQPRSRASQSTTDLIL